MYKDFSIYKVFVAMVICVALFGGATATANFVKSRFGDVSLNIIKLEGKRTLDTLKYFFQARALTKELLSTDEEIINKEPVEFAKAVPVLLYHGILDTPNDVDVSLADFKEQMFALKKTGWQTVNLNDFYLFMRGEKKLPEKSFLLTFDDGTKSSYYRADPILKTLGYTAVEFVITKYSIGDKSGGRYYLSEHELKRMRNSGRWEIQSHSRDAHNFYQIDSVNTQDHFLSNKLWLDSEKRLETTQEFIQRVQNDLLVSKNDIVSRLDVEVTSFAFPFGDFGQNVLDNHYTESTVVNETLSVYPMAFYQSWFSDGDFFNYPDPQRTSFMVKRIEVYAGMSTPDLMKKLQNGQPISLPFHKEKFGGEWTHWWGSVSAGDTLTLKTTPQEKGAATFLAGSTLFKDYSFLARIDYQTGSTASLLFRFKDGDNYLSCNLNGGQIFIEERLNGQSRTVASHEHNLILPNNDFWLGARVKGDSIDCLLDGKVIVEASLPNSQLESGGVGFKLWHQDSGPAALVVNEVLIADSNKESAPVSLPAHLSTSPNRGPEKEKVKAADSYYVTNTDNAVESSPQIVPTVVVQNLVPYEISGTDLPDVWQSIYGNIFTQDNVLHIGSKNSNKASFALLPNSESWSNYRFSATLDWFSGESFGLVARYANAENYVSCDYSFDGASVGLYLMSEGQSLLLGHSPRLQIPLIEPWKNKTFSVEVNDDHVSCLVENEVILQYSLPAMPKTGGIGFTTWDREAGNTDIAIKSVVVEGAK